MRVLMLVSEAPPIKSGIARLAGKLTDGLRARGVTLDVLSANEIARWTFKEFRFSSLVLHWPEIQRRLHDYDILHIHGAVPTFSDAALVLGRLGSRRQRPGLGIVYSHHCDIDIAGLHAPVSLYNAIHHRLLRLADHVVAATPSYVSRLESSTGPGRITPVSYGVEADQFRTFGSKPSRFNVLFVGQLRPYKGVDVLLRAWAHLSNADLHIVGAGHEREMLEALAGQLHLAAVHFHGAVSDQELAGFYAQAHVIVLPSTTRAEAFGLVLLEGMTAGCVPVASDLPGVRDVVGSAGYLFPVGDSAALAERLLRLRDDVTVRLALAVRAAGHSTAYTWDYMVDAYVDIYRQVYLGRQLELASAPGGTTPPVLDAWLRSIARMTRADRASLMLLSRGTRELEIAASVGIEPRVVSSTRLGLGQQMAGFAAQTGRALLVRPGATPVVARLHAHNPAISSALILPISYEGRPAGVLNLARGRDQVAFTYADQRWLERLTAQTAPLFAPHSAPAAAPALSDRRIWALRAANQPVANQMAVLRDTPADRHQEVRAQ